MTALVQRSEVSSQQSEASNDLVEGRLLDGFLLLAAGGSSIPDEVVCVNLSSLQLVDVAVDDLSYFVNLDKLDASDNQLSYDTILAQMARLPRLTSLVLACNSITSLEVPLGSHRNLQTLDLSFNELHGDVLSTLSKLSSLVTLNLSSNCISSVPPEEELFGLKALEELVLDSNDLVQFMQWRSLDALPRLRKLSLASNRVKRLKDDAPDRAASAEVSYFGRLQELNLSGNEIADAESLPVLEIFRSLRRVILSDNPCAKNLRQDSRYLAGLDVVVEETKQWYLQGNGCHQVRKARKEPRMKLNRRRMRRVRSLPQGGFATKAGGLFQGERQLGILDLQANQLMVNLQGPEEPSMLGSYPAGPKPPPVLSFGTGDRGGAMSVASEPAGGILSDDLTEEELDKLFRERRKRIAERFNAEVEEPGSFMRQTPFAISSAAGMKLLATTAGAGAATRARPAGLTGEEEAFAAGTTRSRTSSDAFLTSVAEEADATPAGQLGPPGRTPGAAGSGIVQAALGGYRENSRPLGSRLAAAGVTAPKTPLQPSSGSTLAAAGAAILEGTGSMAGSLAANRSAAAAAFAESLEASGAIAKQSSAMSLPPLGPLGSSSASSAAGGGGGSASRDRAATGLDSLVGGDGTLPLLPPSGALASSSKSRPVPDIGVREALRALRAASMSEYAVAT
eukprot:TRINITY_DN37226_c0_g1_i1.p1 TRINITY_DN37226_c0_g1~~TRINITY_DN37226_c0_g1_i1.p1  ORF type:complete len:680 (-),score=200.40 TRINITY_DN37226_c0_g1_i1:161-2200(-)